MRNSCSVKSHWSLPLWTAAGWQAQTWWWWRWAAAGLMPWSWETQYQTDQVVKNLLPKGEQHSHWCLHSCIFFWSSWRDQSRQRNVRDSGRSPYARPTSVCSGPLRTCCRTQVPPAHIQQVLLHSVTPEQHYTACSTPGFFQTEQMCIKKTPVFPYCFPLLATDCKAIWKFSYRKALDGWVEMVVAFFDILQFS